MGQTPIRMGLIGCGIFGEVHKRTYEQLQRNGRAQLVGVADTNPKIQSQLAQEGIPVFDDYRKLIAETQPDGVSVVTPDYLHSQIVCDALESGCHVLVEKPMDTTVEGCQTMVKMAQSKGLLLQVDFHKRFDPYHRKLHETIAQGQLGQPLYGYAWMEDKIAIPRDYWPAWASKSSPIWFLGSHIIDLFWWLVGCPSPVKVFAQGQKNKLVTLGIDTWDAIEALIIFQHDISLSVNTNWILPDQFEAIVNQGIRVVGTEGVVEIDSQDRGTTACTTNTGQQTWNLGFRLDSTDKWGHPRYEGYGYESIADVVENIEFLRDGGSLEQLQGKYPDGQQGLEVTRICVAIHQSLETGEMVCL